MSGHSKWSTIKRKKGAADAKRGKIFTKIIKEITVAARMGGGDPDANPRLRLAVNQAKAANMPKDNVEKAIKKGTGDLEGVHYEEISYEGYGPGGIAIYIETLTDNKNRTVSEVRYAFSKNNGNLGESGCVAWMFQRKGSLSGPAEGKSEDEIMEIAIEAGAEDVSLEDDRYTMTTAPDELDSVSKAVEAAGLAVEEAGLIMAPQNTLELSGKDAAQALRLIDALEDNDDVQNVFSNLELDEAAMAELADA